MNKVSVNISNRFCPQALFLYGTYREDGMPNFGLFCWFSYCNDKGLGAMACIGEEKLTRDRINATGMFSANLVNESILPYADFCGTNAGYNSHKMSVSVDTQPGGVLNVPIMRDSPLSFELQVTKSMVIDTSEIFICRVRNVMVDERLADDNMTVESRMHLAAPVVTTPYEYFSLGKRLGSWGDWKDK